MEQRESTLGGVAMTKKKRDGLLVYILAHGRPDKTVECVRSVLEQEVEGGFRFIVSDNSGNSEMHEALLKSGLGEGAQGKSTRLEYKKRGEDKSHSCFGHLRLVFDEAMEGDARYLVVFHNDDLMLPGMLAAEKDTLQKGRYAACGSNAGIIGGDSKRKAGSYYKDKEDAVCRTKLEFFRHYFPLDDMSIAVFPSYMYDLERMGHIPPGYDAGKSSDATWLARITSAGPVVMLAKIRCLYRVWDGMDSAEYSVRSTYLLLQAYSKVAKGKKDEIIIKQARAQSLLIYSTRIRGRMPNGRLLELIMHSLEGTPVGVRRHITSQVIKYNVRKIERRIKHPFSVMWRAIMPEDARKVLWKLRHPFKARKVRKIEMQWQRGE